MNQTLIVSAKSKPITDKCYPQCYRYELQEDDEVYTGSCAIFVGNVCTSGRDAEPANRLMEVMFSGSTTYVTTAAKVAEVTILFPAPTVMN